MLNIKRGQHGSTYGGNPVAARVAVAALKVLVEEQLVHNSDRMGKLLRSQLQAIPSQRITEVRHLRVRHVEAGSSDGVSHWLFWSAVALPRACACGLLDCPALLVWTCRD